MQAQQELGVYITLDNICSHISKETLLELANKLGFESDEQES